MVLYRLAYVSHATDDVDVNDFHDIDHKASLHNRELGVTGCLLFCSGWFLQVLEGGLHEVNEIFGKICADKRHNQVIISEMRRIDKRLFPEWNMRFIFHPSRHAIEDIYFKYNVQKDFKPASLEGDALSNFLYEVSTKIDPLKNTRH